MKPQKRRDLKFRFSRGNPFRGLAPGELLLEQISDRQLRAARDHGQSILNYQTRQFFELEALRAAHRDKIAAALQSVPGVPVDVSGWCRAIKGRYAHALLSCVGSMKQSGRFNVGADVDSGQRFPIFPALYVACDRTTAHCEMFGHVQPGSGLRCGVVRRSASGLRLDARQAEACKVERAYERIDHADGILLRDILVDHLGKEGALGSVGFIDEPAHEFRDA